MMRNQLGFKKLQTRLLWLVFALILLNFFVIDIARAVGSAAFDGLAIVGGTGVLIHFAINMAVLVLVAFELFLQSAIAAKVADTQAVMKLGPSWLQNSLYVIIAIVVLLGAVKLFGNFEIAGIFHSYAMNALLVLALCHVVLALFNRYFLDEGLLQRLMETR